MKQLLFIILLMSALSASSQLRWKSYRSGDFNFSARFPSEFQMAQSKPGDSLTWMEINSELETMIFSISVSQSPDPITSVNAYYLASKALSEFILAMDAQKLKDYRVKVGSIEGQGAELLLNAGGNTASVRAFAHKGFIYIIYVIQLHPGADETVKSRFFEDFRIK
jgi:hypothetical protein